MILIFDFDGHLYSGEKTFECVYDWVNTHRREFFPNLTDEQYNTILANYPNLVKVESGKDIAAEMYKIKNDNPNLKIDVKDFWDCQYRKIYDINLTDAHLVDTNFLRALTKLLNCYVVSNSSPTHIYYYMGKIGIDPNGFKRIYSNEFLEFDQTKKHYYTDIAKLENVPYEKLYVYGDSYSSDLKPAEEISANVCQTTDSHKFKENVLKTIKDELLKDSNLKDTLIKNYLSCKDEYESYINSAIFKEYKANKLKNDLENMSSILLELKIEL